MLPARPPPQEPEFEQIFANDPAAVRGKLGAPAEGSDGGGLNAVPGGLLRHHLWPALKPIIRAPWHTDELLDFLEHLFGPFVQLDGFGITGTPAHAYAPDRQGSLVDQGWHRDSQIQSRYQAHSTATHGTTYKPPIGVNCLCYLQDMSPETGALRLVPRSHLGSPLTPSDAESTLPHPDELLLDTKAGDMIVMHGECIHGGTCNASPDLRAYVSTFVTRVGYPHRDAFDSTGPSFSFCVSDAVLVAA